MKAARKTVTFRLRPLAPAALSLALAAGAGAQITPNGDQFQVNTYTTGAQNSPAATTDGRGIVIVAWEHGTQVSGRRFSATGVPLAAEFQVNSLTNAGEYTTNVSADAAGRFVVVWDSFGSPGNDTISKSIQARRFAADGAAAGAQFQVNTTTSQDQRYPDTAKAPAGSFVVVWESENSAGNDTEGSSIQGRLYDVNGSPITAEFQVNNHTPNDQSRPSVAMSAGGFVVAWESYSSPGTDGDFRSIQARRFNSAGAPLAGQFQVNTYTTGVQTQPDVSLDGAGRAVIAWTSNEATGDQDLESIQAQRFAADGTFAGTQFQVNTYTTFSQMNPSVASDAAGKFVIAWDGEGSTGNDTAAYSVQARRYGPAGGALTGEFQVNTYTTSYQREPAVTADAAGNFVVAWQSFGSTGTDGEGYGIHARRYDQLFRDGFSSGNFARWSSTTP